MRENDKILCLHRKWCENAEKIIILNIILSKIAKGIYLEITRQKLVTFYFANGRLLIIYCNSNSRTSEPLPSITEYSNESSNFTLV